MAEKLTGKIRHRSARVGGLFGKEALVLQVEVAYDEGPSDANGMPGYLAGIGWRDAKVEDLSEFTINGKVATL